MKFNIISNISNGTGLQRDYELMRGMLANLGHEVNGIQFNQIGAHRAPLQTADVNLFLETIVPALFGCAPRQWVIPNPEWWRGECTEHLGRFEYVLCKTREAERIFRELVVGACHGKPAGTPWRAPTIAFIGFQARDLYRPEITREHRWLHVAGKSRAKNTAAVIEAWRQGYSKLPLTVVAEYFSGKIPGVTFHHRVIDEQLTEMMNSHLYHIMPSEYEGFGHALNESLAVGALIVTMDGEPMREIVGPCAFLAKVDHTVPMNLGTLHKASADGLRGAIQTLEGLPAWPETLAWMTRARYRYQVRALEFQENFSKFMAEAAC